MHVELTRPFIFYNIWNVLYGFGNEMFAIWLNLLLVLHVGLVHLLYVYCIHNAH